MMDLNNIENSLSEIESNVPSMLNAILRTNIQNQALLRGIINNQAVASNIKDPTVEIDFFKNQTTEYCNSWMIEILADIASKM